MTRKRVQLAHDVAERVLVRDGDRDGRVGARLVHRGDLLVALRLAHVHRLGGDAVERDVEV